MKYKNSYQNVCVFLNSKCGTDTLAVNLQKYFLTALAFRMDRIYLKYGSNTTPPYEMFFLMIYIIPPTIEVCRVSTHYTNIQM